MNLILYLFSIFVLFRFRSYLYVRISMKVFHTCSRNYRFCYLLRVITVMKLLCAK